MLEKQFLEAARRGDLKMVQDLVSNKKVSTDAKDENGNTALLLATYNGHLAIMQWLVTEKAVPLDQKNNNGDAALLLAACKGHLAIVQWLVNEKAVPLDQKNNDGNTALLRAAYNGQLAIVQWLVTEKAVPLDQKNNDGNTALLRAAWNGQLAIVQWLVTEKAVPLDQKSNDGNTALLLAAWNGQLAVVQWLVTEKAVPLDQKNNVGNTALLGAANFGHLAIVQWLVTEKAVPLDQKNNVGYTALLLAAFEGHLAIVQWLVTENAVPLDQKNNFGYTALLLAACNGHLAIMQWLVTEKAVPLDQKNNFGYTALLLAACYGHLAIMQWLVNEKAVPLDQKNNDGAAALLAAACYGHLAIMQWLVNEKAVPLDQKNNNGDAALLLAACKGHLAIVQWLVNEKAVPLDQKNNDGNTALLGAANFGHLVIVQWLVTEKAVPLDQKNNVGYTALLLAAFEGHLAIVQWLVTEKAVPLDQKNNDGNTALLRAAWNGQLAIVQWLVTEKAVPLDQKNNVGYTALLVAACKGYLAIVQWLVNEKAVPLDQKNNDGNTALLGAANFGHLVIVQWLVTEKAVPLDQKNNDGNTALLGAANFGHLVIVQWLVTEKAVALDQKNNSGETALDKAVTSKHPALIEWLESANLILPSLIAENLVELRKTIQQKPKLLADFTLYEGTTLLIYAVKNKLKKAADFLIEENINILATDNAGNTALHIAASQNCDALIERLAFAGIAIDALNKQDQTALHIACQQGHAKSAETLLNLCAEPFIFDQDKRFPLQLGIMAGHEDILYLFLDTDPQLQEIFYAKTGKTLLHIIIECLQYNLLEHFVRYLEKNEQILDWEIRDEQGLTPLHLAAKLGDIRLMQRLLSLEASALTPDRQENNLLHLSVLNQQLEVINWLAQKIPSLFSILLEGKNQAGQTPLALAEAQDKTEKTLRIFNVLNLHYKQKAKKTAPQTALKEYFLYFQTTKIRNLIFQGGSVKGVAYVGVVQAMQKRGKNFGIEREHIERVGGASVGSITAMLLGVGYNLEQLQSILTELDILSFLDHESTSVWMNLKKANELLPEASTLLGTVGGSAKRLIHIIYDQIMPKGTRTLAEGGIKFLKMLVPQKVIDVSCHAQETALQLAPAAIALATSSTLRDSLHGFSKTGGIFPGHKVREWLDAQIQQRTQLANTTFRELHDLRKQDANFKDIYVVALNLTTGRIEVISYEKEQFADVIIADAIRASMSIPVVFEPCHLYYKTKEGERKQLSEAMYVDGGVGDNYPIGLFDYKKYADFFSDNNNQIDNQEYYYNCETLGFRLVDSSLKEEFFNQAQPEQALIENPLALFKALIAFFLGNRYESAHAQSHNQGRTVYIKTCGVGMLDFDISDDQKHELIEAGELAFYDYLGLHGEAQLNIGLSKDILHSLLHFGAQFDVSWKCKALDISNIKLTTLSAEGILQLHKTDLLTLEAGAYQQTINYLQRLGLVIDRADAKGQTALALAIARGEDEACYRLIKGKARIDIVDDDSNSLLDIACGLAESQRGFRNQLILKLIKRSLYSCKRPDKVYAYAEQALIHNATPGKYQKALNDFLMHHLKIAFSTLFKYGAFELIKPVLIEKIDEAAKALTHYYGLIEQLSALFPQQFSGTLSLQAFTKAPLTLQDQADSEKSLSVEKSLVITTHPSIEYLVFGGGHAGAIGYVGALTTLIEAKIEQYDLSKLKGAGGCSFGSLLAFLLMIGHPVTDLKEILQEFSAKDWLGVESTQLINDFKNKLNSAESIGKMLEMVLPANIFKQRLKQVLPVFNLLVAVGSVYQRSSLLDVAEKIKQETGLFKLEPMQHWLENKLKEKSIAKDVTFKELFFLTQRDLRIVILDISTGRVKTFSKQHSPDAVVIDAVCAALAIPAICQPRRIRFKTNGHITYDGSCYLDASIAKPYPIDLFDEEAEHNPQVLGLRLVTRAIKQEHETGIAVAKKVVAGPMSLMKGLMDFYYSDFAESEHQFSANKSRTLCIDIRNVHQFDFELFQAQKQRLYDSGRIAGHHYLYKQQIELFKIASGKAILAQLFQYSERYQILVRRNAIAIEHIRLEKISSVMIYKLLLSLPEITVSTLKLLQELGVNFNIPDESGRLVLHSAIDSAEIEKVRELLKAKVISNLAYRLHGESYIDYTLQNKALNEAQCGKLIELFLKEDLLQTSYPAAILLIAKSRYEAMGHPKLKAACRQLEAQAQQIIIQQGVAAKISPQGEQTNNSEAKSTVADSNRPSSVVTLLSQHGFYKSPALTINMLPGKLFEFLEQWELNKAIEQSLQEKPESKLKERANAFGFQLKNVAPDGNCFFHAVLDQLHLHDKAPENCSQKKLRQIATDHIIKHFDLYAHSIDDKDPASFIQKLAQDKTWADHLIIQALSRALNITIAIIRDDDAAPIIIKQASPIATVYLGYEVGRHYGSLISDPELEATQSIAKYIRLAEIDDRSITENQSFNTLSNNNNNPTYSPHYGNK